MSRSRSPNPDGAAQPAAERRPSTGNDITVNPATDATGAITSTAQQVVDAINANPAAATWCSPRSHVDEHAGSGVATNAGDGVVAADREDDAVGLPEGPGVAIRAGRRR